MPKQLINRKEDVVVEALEGICATAPFLKHLDGFPDIKVVVDATVSKNSKVAVVSGGGSGHEPAHAGYIGPGMLSAVAAGDVFASPPTEAVLAAILAVTGEPGCLLIVKNYTGDRLNFGLAAEQAKGLGLNVELVVVGDDCALPGTGIAGRRGIAGTVFVHKIAGAAAAKGLRLTEVKAEAEAAAKAVGSMGMATRTCILPGGDLAERLGEHEVEMGLGIHGEPGASKQPIAPVRELVKQIVDTTLKFMEFGGSRNEFALLVNNLGGATCLEMAIVTNAAIQHVAQTASLKLARVYSGTFMTSLDMPGFSISLLRLQPHWKELLDAPTQAPAWPGKPAEYSDDSPKVQLPKAAAAAGGFTRPAELQAFGVTTEACLKAAAAALQAATGQLDEWDRQVGDGDCGATVARGAATIEDAVQRSMPLNDAAGAARCLADCCRSMGGTSGALYNILFTAAAATLPSEGPAAAAQLADAFRAGADAVMRYGGAKAGSRTMLDAVLPAAEALSAALGNGKSAVEAAEAAAAAAESGAESTRHMTAAAGRASYVPAAAAEGVPDPGAKAVAVWLRAVAASLAGR